MLLLEFLPKTWAIPIMNSLSWFMTMHFIGTESSSLGYILKKAKRKVDFFQVK